MNKVTAMTAGVAVLLSVSAAAAQTQPMAPAQGQHQGGAHAPGQQSQQPMMGHMGHMGHGMMGMCPMMGGMMGSADPKAQARMLRLRGDMMKAMGDVLLKHAQEIEQVK
jgi:hypothetical protein